MVEPVNALDGVFWLKSAIIHDLISYAGIYGWRGNSSDLNYPDAVVEETYLIEADRDHGTYVRAIPGIEGAFERVPMDGEPTPWGWRNPYVQDATRFDAYTVTVNEAISQVLDDTNLRSYCDRYGTYRLEAIDYEKPVVAEYTNYENLLVLNKSIDYSRARSHVVIAGAGLSAGSSLASFVDKELLMELKGELRTAFVLLEWATTFEAKREAAKRLFMDMKRICRTVQVQVPGNPVLDILDRVIIRDRNTATNTIYIIKAIQHSITSNGYTTTLDLLWGGAGEDVLA